MTWHRLAVVQVVDNHPMGRCSRRREWVLFSADVGRGSAVAKLEGGYICPWHIRVNGCCGVYMMFTGGGHKQRIMPSWPNMDGGSHGRKQGGGEENGGVWLTRVIGPWRGGEADEFHARAGDADRVAALISIN